MKYFLIAGEASGDLHASNLMKELIRHDPKGKLVTGIMATCYASTRSIRPSRLLKIEALLIIPSLMT